MSPFELFISNKIGVNYCILIPLNSKYKINPLKGNSVMLLTKVVHGKLSRMSGGTHYERFENHYSK